MLQKGAIRDANLFVIPKKIGDLRPVINKKKNENEFVQYHYFKKEGLNSLLDHLLGSEFLTAIEIKDAYLTIPRHSDCLLGFRRSQGFSPT